MRCPKCTSAAVYLKAALPGLWDYRCAECGNLFGYRQDAIEHRGESVALVAVDEREVDAIAVRVVDGELALSQLEPSARAGVERRVVALLLAGQSIKTTKTCPQGGTDDGV